MKYEFLFAGLAALLAAGVSASPPHWPAVKPTRESHLVVVPTDSSTDTPFAMTIRSVAGKPLYRLECHGDNYDVDTLISFSGTFQCALFPLAGSRILPGNLLVANNRDEQSTDWWNRGRMLSEQLLPGGPCRAYPEYGALRHLRLRGMVITLHYADPVWREQAAASGPALGQFLFVVDVQSDVSATSATAATVPGPKPPRACY